MSSTWYRNRFIEAKYPALYLRHRLGINGVQSFAPKAPKKKNSGGAKVCKKKRSGGAKVCRKEKVGQCLPLLLSRMVTPPLHQISYMSDSDSDIRRRESYLMSEGTCISTVSPAQMRSD